MFIKRVRLQKLYSFLTLIILNLILVYIIIYMYKQYYKKIYVYITKEEEKHELIR